MPDELNKPSDNNTLWELMDPYGPVFTWRCQTCKTCASTSGFEENGNRRRPGQCQGCYARDLSGLSDPPKPQPNHVWSSSLTWLTADPPYTYICQRCGLLVRSPKALFGTGQPSLSGDAISDLATELGKGDCVITPHPIPLTQPAQASAPKRWVDKPEQPEQRQLPLQPDRCETVNHPQHYTPGPFEVFRVLIAWGFANDAMLWDALIYIARCKKKGNELKDLQKARFWLNRKIEVLEGVDHTKAEDKTEGTK